MRKMQENTSVFLIDNVKDIGKLIIDAPTLEYKLYNDLEKKDTFLVEYRTKSNTYDFGIFYDGNRIKNDLDGFSCGGDDEENEGITINFDRLHDKKFVTLLATKFSTATEILLFKNALVKGANKIVFHIKLSKAEKTAFENALRREFDSNIKITIAKQNQFASFATSAKKEVNNMFRKKDVRRKDVDKDTEPLVTASLADTARHLRERAEREANERTWIVEMDYVLPNKEQLQQKLCHYLKVSEGIEVSEYYTVFAPKKCAQKIRDISNSISLLLMFVIKPYRAYY